MNRLQLIVICMLIFTFQNIHCQKKKVTRREGVQEIYHYKKIKGIGKVRCGSYKCYFTDNVNPRVLINQGQYVDNKKSGIWTYFNTIGDTICSFDFDKDTVVSYDYSVKRTTCEYIKVGSMLKLKRDNYELKDEPSFGNLTVNAKGDIVRTYSIDTNLDSDRIFKPLYIEGDKELYDIMFSAILSSFDYYNINSLNKTSYNFKAYITLAICRDGTLKDIFIRDSSKNLKYLKKILMSKDLKWIPAYRVNEPIDYALTIPVICKTTNSESIDYNKLSSFDPNTTFSSESRHDFFTLRFWQKNTEKEGVYRHDWPMQIANIKLEEY